MENKYDIFISYSRHDLKLVTKIKNELERETGSSCWMDLDGIESGEQFENVIISAINRSNTVLFMMSTHSMNSEWALDELNFAKKKKKRIVLVAIEDVKITDVFYFRFHKYDQIEWANQRQREKLIRDVKKWKAEVEKQNNRENKSISEKGTKQEVVFQESVNQNSILGVDANGIQNHFRMRTLFDKDEPLWDILIQQILEGNVIPVIGPDFLIEDKENPHKLIVDYLAKIFQVNSSPNSFSELLYDSNYKNNSRKDDIYYQVNRILDGAIFDPSPLLMKLMATKQFPFVITTSFTPIVEQAMRDVWKEELRIMRFCNDPSENDDIRSVADLSKPVVYYMFGKVGKGTHRYALTDTDLMDFVASWLSIENRYGPNILCDCLRGKYLLFLGNNYTDWFFRFIWHSLQRAAFGNGMFVSDSIDESLLRFLNRTETFIQLNTDKTIEKIISLLNKKLMENETIKFDRPRNNMDIFISYSRCDCDIAEKLYVNLTAQGKRVWYDRNNLAADVYYLDEIQTAISTAEYFIPILSENIIREKGESHVYRNEWNTAINVANSKGRTYIIPLAEVGFDFYDSSIPEKIQQKNAIFYSKDDDMDKIAKKIILLMNNDK